MLDMAPVSTEIPFQRLVHVLGEPSLTLPFAGFVDATPTRAREGSDTDGNATGVTSSAEFRPLPTSLDENLL